MSNSNLFDVNPVFQILPILHIAGKVPKGLQEAQGIKSGSPRTPELATQTTAKPVRPDLTFSCCQLYFHKSVPLHRTRSTSRELAKILV